MKNLTRNALRRLRQSPAPRLRHGAPRLLGKGAEILAPTCAGLCVTYSPYNPLNLDAPVTGLRPVPGEQADDGAERLYPPPHSRK